MTKPEKGFFSFEVGPCVTYVHPKFVEKVVKDCMKHREYVDENGVGNCKCLYCEEKRKEEFDETYGEE